MPLRIVIKEFDGDVINFQPPKVEGFHHWQTSHFPRTPSNPVPTVLVVYLSNFELDEVLHKREWYNFVLMDLMLHFEKKERKLREQEKTKRMNEKRRIMDKIRHDRNIAKKKRYIEKYGNRDREKEKKIYFANKKALEDEIADYERVVIEYLKSVVKNSDCPICYEYVHTKPCYQFDCQHAVCYDCSKFIKDKRCPLCRSF
jgi:hypothetical protein